MDYMPNSGLTSPNGYANFSGGNNYTDPYQYLSGGGSGGFDWSKLASGASDVLGGAGGIAGGIEGANMYNLLTNPSALAQGSMQMMMPMSQMAQDMVGRQVYGQLAQRGITSGGVADAAVSEAFANQEMQRQQMAQQSYIQALLAAYKGGTQGSDLFGGMGGLLQGGAEIASLFAK